MNIGIGLMKKKRVSQHMRARFSIPTLLCTLLICASFAGCIGDEEESGKDSAIDFVVYYETTSGVIEEVMQNDQQVSETGVEVKFDFSYTKSSAGEMVTFYYIPGDGSSMIENNAAENGEITYTYLTHGLFSAAIGAIDDQENEYFENITIRIDKRITWSDDSTTAPDAMNIETTPDCDCVAPEQIKIDSTVANPENGQFGPFQGQTVTVTWRLLNSTDAVATESAPEQIGDGQDASWMYNQYFIEPGTWKLEVDVTAEGDGDEQVNVDHIVTIAYVADESIPNPMTAPEAEE
ncbi:hypothetical protein N9P14_00495 [Candidatus Poseidoniaceae archaeon]|nr:hypothetical protein [Candidatus Poseidoniaceae archaeon]